MSRTRLIWTAMAVFASGVHAQTWTELNPAVRPAARRNASMALDVQNGRAVLFGGDVGDTSTPIVAATDTFLWDGSVWTQVIPTNPPPARRLHALLYGEERSEIVLFGGMGNGDQMLADTWVWNAESTSRLF